MTVHRQGTMMTVPPTNADHDLGFTARLSRRSALAALAGLGITAVAACGSDGSKESTSTAGTTTGGTDAASTTLAATDTTSGAAATAAGECLDFPQETNGPFPADGSNDDGNGDVANILADSRSVRASLTTNLDGSDEQPGIPLTLTMVITDKDGCTPKANAAVYAWHCNREGHYSVYNSNMNGGDYSDATWFRGVQITNANGAVTFQTIFPGRYDGRATHIHFEVYEDSAYGNLLLTSQVGFVDAEADAVYSSDSNYASSLSNPTYNSVDNVFGDGDGSQILNVAAGDAVAATVTIGL
jgi:protocatechuate 3,4-dioxygenase beta subunit